MRVINLSGMPPRNDAPFAVHVPPAADDRPSWVKVGVIAALGFAIGIAWPRIAGVRLGPSAPADAVPASSPAPRVADTAGNVPASIASASGSQAPLTSPVAPVAAAPSGPPVVAVARGLVMSCKTEDGESLKGGSACGGAGGFDAVAMPRFRRLAACSAAEGATGKLSATVYLDFPNNRVNVDIGKGSTVPNVESIGGCLKQQFAGVSLGAVDHTHPRYTLLYSATLAPSQAPSAQPNAAAPGAAAPMSADSPTASVVWEVAIVRDTPRTGQVVARLQRGTKIRLGNVQEGWYRVRYGSAFSSEGWVYRGAIGK